MKVTRQLLRDVGVCGPYVRAFSDAFPSEDYPDGVELNRETCAAHADEFDWSWAAAEFLNWEGRSRWDELRVSRTAEAREFGAGDEKKAALFGHLFDTVEDYRNPRVVELALTADERADRRTLEAVQAAESDLREAHRQVQYWTAELPRREVRLAETTATKAGALRRIAARKAEERVRAVAEAEARLVKLREDAAAAEAELAKLAAEPEVPAAEPAPVPAEVS